MCKGTQRACLNDNLLPSQGARMVSRKQLPERNDSAPPGCVLAPGDAVQLQWLQQVQDGTLSKSLRCLCVKGYPGTLAAVQLVKAAAGEIGSRQGLRAALNLRACCAVHVCPPSL